ncbi:phage tail tape measure protein, TP901 family [Peptoniphilus sp. ING2-D1G]|nr:phage tail tape measure protein, TP901 family [Peptoniphilus sp. ING2-D1G]
MANARELIWSLKTKDGASTEISKIDKKIDKLKENMQNADSASGRLSSKFGLAGAYAQKMGGKITATSKKIAGFGGKMTKAMLPVSLAVGKGVKDFLSLDTAIRQVTTLTDENVLPVSQIKKDVKEISNATGRSQEEIANAMYDSLSSGVDQSKVTDFVKSGIDLVRAGFTDMPTVIDATTTALNAYGDAAPEVSKIHDIFVKTQDLGKITVDELGKSIGRVVPTAAAAGVSLEQLGAGYSVLTAKGMNAELATTTMNSLLGELSATGSKSDKALRKMTGKSFKELTKEGKNVGEVLGILQENAKGAGLELADMFGNLNAGKAANSLLSDGVEGFSKVLDQIQNSDGATAENAMKMMGPAEKMQVATTRMQNAFIDAGGAIAPYVVQIADGISSIVGKFSELDEGTQGSIMQWVGLAIAIGPVVSIIGTVGMVVGGAISVFGTLLGVFGTIISVVGSVGGAFFGLMAAIGPVGWVIMAVVGVGVYLISNFKKIKATAEELGGGIKGYLLATLKVTGDNFTSLKDKAVSALNGIKNAWESVKNFLKNPIKGVISIAQKGAASIGGGSAAKGAAVDVRGGRVSRQPHATGLEKVPFDNYPADLHKDEMVLTASAAKAFRAIGGSKNSLPANNSGGNSISNSPNIIVNVYGERTENEAINIGQRVRQELDSFFKEMQLQRA